MPIKINLQEIKNNKLNESSLESFASLIESLLRRMFNKDNTLVSIKGSKEDVQLFSETLVREKKYLESIREYGINNPKTCESKIMLDDAVKNFQETIGVPWPFKE
jgi:hypothetical protein